MQKGVFERCGLDLHVFPHKTILIEQAILQMLEESLKLYNDIKSNPPTQYYLQRSTRQDQSIISLEIFQIVMVYNKFLAEDSLQFQIARQNLIKSQAAYSIISYIQQKKDRHNGNILISDKGHLIHIDFGFIFDISPRGILNLNLSNSN
ncbi:unnamed protein product (macronuclear) [Paramecium tetraurelia]|uniref:PI3K/PI4K catalytic domain-containing protein n=1 Tax=Paramecium tetraurelia TaxID=5888 RepID=A0E9V9_PARTE|nr:uncharacterized protein GSPATT00024807001 [Paramecium tetraurelia]CAK92076.1 unnamed protein product [Paramecium tetraurelia]|eukprot:XP_001459473.1 hypothetical protein (macronuclear) [Paramecium tetraurelia strain d4-2]